MSTHAKKAKKAEYDPARQWGLKPEPDSGGGGGATYFVEGHVVAGSNDAKSLFVAETIGRDAQARASRKAASLETDRALQLLLKRDKEGTRALASARAAAAWGCVHAWDSPEHRSVLVRGAGARPATPAGAAWCSLACPAERVLGGRLR